MHIYDSSLATTPWPLHRAVIKLAATMPVALQLILSATVIKLSFIGECELGQESRTPQKTISMLFGNVVSRRVVVSMSKQ